LAYPNPLVRQRPAYDVLSTPEGSFKVNVRGSTGLTC